MKKIMFFLSWLIALSCAKGAGEGTGDLISYSEAEFEALINTNDKVQLVDVRRPDEYAAGHIEKAMLIDVTASDFLSKANRLLDKSRPVALYCRSGARSRKAASILIKEGYTVYHLDKGYNSWVRYQQQKKDEAR